MGNTTRNEIPHCIAQEPLAARILALTGSFETGRMPPDCFGVVAGDFDRQGLSFGALQWNFGQGTLQKLLHRMNRRYPDKLRSVFGEDYPVLMAVIEADRETALRFARSIQDESSHKVGRSWRTKFKVLGLSGEGRQVQVAEAAGLFKSAQRKVGEYGLRSERAVALMFDISVQNGGISRSVKNQILSEYARLPENLSNDLAESSRLEIVARCRAEASHPRWVADVRRRKLAIARGEGWVHGRFYNLLEQFGISLRPASSDA